MVQDLEKARNLGEDLFFEKKFGRNRVRRELVKRGLEEELVNQVIEGLNPGFEERHIKHIIANKYGRRVFVDREREKITKALVRYGYEEDKVIEVLNCLERAEF